MALTDGQTGMLVPNGDIAELAERILFVLRNPAIGAQLGRAGQQLVTDRFDFGVLARRLEAFYQRVVGEPAAVVS